MLIIPPTPFRRRRRVRGVAGPPALVLVAAKYAEALWVRLTFDRPIGDIGIVGSLIVVNDATASGRMWAAEGTATLLMPEAVEIELVDVGEASGEAQVLNAAPGNGITGFDGGLWPGVTGLVLPFP